MSQPSGIARSVEAALGEPEVATDPERLRSAAPLLYEALHELALECAPLYGAGRLPAETWLRAMAALRSARS